MVLFKNEKRKLATIKNEKRIWKVSEKRKTPLFKNEKRKTLFFNEKRKTAIYKSEKRIYKIGDLECLKGAVDLMKIEPKCFNHS